MKAEKSRKCILIVFCIVFVFINFFISSVLKAEVMFIVNPSAQQDALSKSEIKSIFLGDRLVWSNGEEIHLVMHGNSDTQREFAKTYTQKTESQFSNYWRRIMFSGKGMLPKSFSTDKEIINFVTNTKGAIGYISPQTITKDIKTIIISDD